MVLKNVLIIKDQEKSNGTFLDFAEMGRIENLFTNAICIKGIETICRDYNCIRRQSVLKDEL